MTQEILDQVEAVRRFSRFYTRHIGVLHEGLLGSSFSLTEGRVIWELAYGGKRTASALAAHLGLDTGYLSRILRGFEERGLIRRTPSSSDGRQSDIELTEAGVAASVELAELSRGEVGAMLERLPPGDRTRLVDAMAEVETLFATPRAEPVLRRHRPGDLGWIVERHGTLYAEEFGFDGSFEALVAGIVGDFAERNDTERERCWIAEYRGRRVGSVMLVRQSDEVAKLRVLIVDPSARGLGVGKRLVDACADFARSAGYRRVTLWTNSVLVAARGIYERAGYRLVHQEPHVSFGQELVSETWELEL